MRGLLPPALPTPVCGPWALLPPAHAPPLVTRVRGWPRGQALGEREGFAARAPSGCCAGSEWCTRGAPEGLHTVGVSIQGGRARPAAPPAAGGRYLLYLQLSQTPGAAAGPSVQPRPREIAPCGGEVEAPARRPAGLARAVLAMVSINTEAFGRRLKRLYDCWEVRMPRAACLHEQLWW